MFAIDPTSTSTNSTGAIPKKILTPKDTPPEKLQKQLKRAFPGSATAPSPTAPLACDHSTREQRRSTLQPRTKGAGKSVFCMDVISKVLPDYKHVAHTKSPAMPSSERKIHSDILHRQKLSDKLFAWSVTIALTDKIPQTEQGFRTKTDEDGISGIRSLFDKIDIFQKDSKQDKIFICLVEEIASLSLVNKNEQKIIDSFIYYWDEAKSCIDRGANRENTKFFFRMSIQNLLDDHMGLFPSFETQCKLISELRKNGLDITDSFRRHVIAEYVAKRKILAL